MTVREYLKITDANKIWFNTGINQFEKFHSYTERHTKYFSGDIKKWLDKTITSASVMSDGTLRIFAQ